MQVSMLPSQSGAFQAIVVNNPGGQSVGPVMKVKHFRIHAVTDQTILFNWALIYAPDGIGVLKFTHLVSTRKSRNRSSL